MMSKEVSEYTTYQDAKDRLDQIVIDVRSKDISLESSLDLLEEGVALANKCTELIDVASWSSAGSDEGDRVDGDEMRDGDERELSVTDGVADASSGIDSYDATEELTS